MKLRTSGPGPTIAIAPSPRLFAEERPRLLPLPAHEFSTDRVVVVRSAKTIYVRFDGNDYSIPPEAVGAS